MEMSHINDKLVKVLFFGRSDKGQIWEHDFIINDILIEFKNKESHFLSLNDVREKEEQFDVVVYSARDPNNYPWGYIPTYDDILECVLKTKPKVVIQLSDEFSYENLQQHNELGNYCELFLRQYHHNNYQYTPNTLHIPLGYYNGYDVSGKEIKPVRDRTYTWSFVGTKKSDRLHLTNIFSEIPNNYCLLHEGSIKVPSEEIIEIYINSIFVPCSRGWSSLNTMRSYEVSMSGSIPVLVGTQEEIEYFSKFEENPPWLFFDSWENASKKCQELLNDLDALQEIQNNILSWWNKRVGKIQKRASMALTEKLKNFPSVNYISVEDSIERRSLLCQKFEQYGITNIRPNIFERYDDTKHKFVGDSADLLLGVGRGPTTSHLKAIKNWYFDTDEEYAFFCEDDLSFETVDYWNFTWQEFFDKLPQGWECVQLCWVRENVFLFSHDGIALRNRCWCDWSACAYLVKRSHAKKLISHYYRDGEFNLKYCGNDAHGRPQWAYRPTAETVVYTDFSRIYGFPLFVEDSKNCQSTLGPGVGAYNAESYKVITNWWETEGKKLTVDEIMRFYR